MTNEQMKISYSGLHSWILYNWGNASKCENLKCKVKYPKRHEWALKKGKKYSKNKEDYLQLCPSCHKKYDFTEKMRNRLSNININNSNACKVVEQYDLKGSLIKIFDSLTLAAKELSISRTSISNCLAGDSKTAGKFIWRRI